MSGQTLEFNGPGEKLTVGGAEVDSTTFGATIHSFGSGDSIDLTGVGVGDNWSFDGTTLTVLQGPTTVLATLTLAGLDSGTQFSVVGDGGDGTRITNLSEAGDQDQWNGGTSGSWNAAANWIDITARRQPGEHRAGKQQFRDDRRVRRLCARYDHRDGQLGGAEDHWKTSIWRASSAPAR